MSLTKKQFFKNSFWTLLELSMYPLLMIVATPIFIKKLGIEQYGLWMLVSTITIGINVLNIGVADTNIRLISRYRAEGKPDSISDVFNFNFSFSLVLCSLAFTVGCVFYFFDFISLLYKSTDYHFANMLLLLACFSTGIKFVENSIISVFKAFERFDISSKMILLSKNSVMLFNIGLVLLNFTLIEVFLSSLLVGIANVVVQLVVLHFFKPGLVQLPTLQFYKGKFDYFNYNFWYWLQSVVALLGFVSDKLVVAYFTDVRTLGYYSIASLIGTNIHNFFLSFGSFIFPRVSYKMAENKEVSKLYFVARSLVALPGWTLIASLLLVGDLIFHLWLGTETYLNSIYYIKLYLIYEAAMLLIIVPFYFINGSSSIKLNSVFEIVLRSSHLIAMVAGYYAGGVSGVIYGLIISTVLNIPFQYFYFHRKIVSGIGRQQYLWVFLPVVFLAGLIISWNLLFHLSLILCLIISCKIIYFDPARLSSRGFFAFSALFRRS